MEFSMDISWIALLLSITGCLLGIVAVRHMLYVPPSRIQYINEHQLVDGTTSKNEPQSQLLLGFIRRKKSFRKESLKQQAEEDSFKPLLSTQSMTIIREELQCIHGFIQSYRFYNPCSPSCSRYQRTGALPS